VTVEEKKLGKLMLPANGVLGLGFGKRAESHSIQLSSDSYNDVFCDDVRPIEEYCAI
jgi:hypothetical protein